MDIQTIRIELLKLAYRKDLDAKQNIARIEELEAFVLKQPEGGKQTLTLGGNGNKANGNRPT